MYTRWQDDQHLGCWGTFRVYFLPFIKNVYRVSLTYTILFQKIWHKSNSAWFRIDYAYCQLYMYVQGVQFKSKIQHTGIWLAIAWPPRCPCYRPAVLFHHLHLIVFLFPQGEILHVSKMLFLSILIFTLLILHKCEIV